ncbi:hypothetical protein FXO38_35331 [Capsicum annuum]|uniref:Uncharacterized protein n=1 Tax=Capsicum annuum TaxID=4072 RepID=A0A2G2ZXC2_CAPAN|nr:hypothetical protein FXO38_35331 [Capsicum annuum]KAF3623455.1 hypothetical protein FXO37_31862 [Capsicum annuum]PHT86640.1 hypothetical protein T459_08746 [Capsicum annuum]
MELEISSSKVNQIINSPDSPCWQIEQAWEPDMLFFNFILLPASPMEDFTLWSHSSSPTATIHHHHDHQESVTGPYGPCSELYYDFHPERGTSNVVHHTSSHLLQSALKRVIGQEISPAGSMVDFDRLRLDFNFHRPVLDKNS